MKKLAYISMAFYILFSCENKNSGSREKNVTNDLENQIVITNEGDSLEHGFWKYDFLGDKVYKSGFYENGYKVGEWHYSSPTDSLRVSWKIFNKGKVKFNFPGYLKTTDSLEYPLLFQGDIVDDNSNTYVALLMYDLEKVNGSIYGYLYEVNQRRETNSAEVLQSKDVRKFYFKNIDVFRYHVQVKRGTEIYEVISYVFEVNGKLYDITLKDLASEITSIDHEVFQDMLYSMQCNGRDLFTYNSGQYYKEENVAFE